MDERKLIQDFDRKQKSHKHKSKQRRDKDPSSNSRPDKSINASNKKARLEEPDFVQPSSSISYRDRAKERREGLNKDFELDPDDLRISNPILENPYSSNHETGNPIVNEIDDEQARRLQQIEDSKYLGGDVEHTHLVKGLDFALLEKVKNDQKLAEKLAEDREKDDIILNPDGDGDSEEEEFINQAIIAASNSKRQLIDIEKLKKGLSTEIIPCRTAITRRILNVLDEKWPDKSELFLPGRMSYIIPIGEDCEDNSVTTILRSKKDTTMSNDGKAKNDSTLDQLINILAKLKRNSQSDSAKRAKMFDNRDDYINDYY